MTWSICLCYLDDVTAFSSIFVEHFHCLRRVLDCIRASGLQLNSKKCTVGVREMKLLDNILSSYAIRPDPDKLHTVADTLPYVTSKT